MIEQDVTIPMAEGTAEAVLYQPETNVRFPGVIHLTDIGGIRPAHREMARRISNEGFVVLMPNVFYRNARPPVMEQKDRASQDALMNRVRELSAPLTPESIESDTDAYIAFLTGRESVSDSKIGVVGHCFSGAVAMRMAAARPDKVGAIASFHGGGLYTDAATSPHLVLPRIKAEAYFAHAVQDKSMPAEAIEKFEKALADWGGKYESETYEGAYHSWTALDSPVYNQSQAERAFAKLVELLKRTLRP